ncbi:pyrroline-5-carboxylate reductase [Legionella dresdenensis]|uniref:Pyrroline-5-carboxylate reductase n=1 Tax=Legionella dresdenensis TaxID=450200 RepID=A0ABV8CET3_9GAMM
MKVCFIGYGNMAQAIAAQLKQINSIELFASSPSLTPKAESGITTHYDNKKFIHQAHIVILAVKPAKINQVVAEIVPLLSDRSVLLSLAAGITLKRLESLCGHQQAIVRAMPNTPVAVGCGATPLLANPHVTAEQKQWLETLFQSTGITTWVDDERLMNAYTAVSGSGPAYVFLYLEAMIATAEKLGIPPEQARDFSLQTLSGAVELLRKSNLSPQELRQQVTSPAGTTEAAIHFFEQHQFKQTITGAVKAACNRAVELGQEHNSESN